MTRVMVVDDHPAMREGLAAILMGKDGMSVVSGADSAEEALSVLEQNAPEVMLVDLRLTGMDGIDLCRVVSDRHPRVRVIVFTCLRDEYRMMTAFAAGAKGFLVKTATPQTIRHAVEVVAEGGTFVDPSLADKLVAKATRSRRTEGRYGLTHQERRVLELLPEGQSNRDIATTLDLSLNTVKTHLRNAMRKLQVHDRAQAAAFVEREGLV